MKLSKPVPDPWQVEPVSRQVIEHQLLTALESGGIAVLCSKSDLQTLAKACELLDTPQSLNLAEGFRRLILEAFPDKTDKR
jgi:hypothetical protein